MGKMGLLHASILNAMPGVRVAAIYDKNPRMTEFAQKALPDISVTDNFEKFSHLILDAVYVTTPIPTHFSVLKAMYTMGISKNLFVEKTLASNYDQAAQLCKEAKAVGGVSMVGYMNRFARTFQKAKSLLQRGAIGTVSSFTAYAYSSDFMGTRGRSVPARGGATRDLGSHVIDLSLWFFGDLELEATRAEASAHESDENSTSFAVRGLNGLIGEIDISWAKEGYRLPEFGLGIDGSRGAITVNGDTVKLTKTATDSVIWRKHDMDDTVPFFLGASEYYREDEHFIRSILESRVAEPDFTTASKVDYLIDRISAA